MKLGEEYRDQITDNRMHCTAQSTWLGVIRQDLILNHL